MLLSFGCKGHEENKNPGKRELWCTLDLPYVDSECISLKISAISIKQESHPCSVDVHRACQQQSRRFPRTSAEPAPLTRALNVTTLPVPWDPWKDSDVVTFGEVYREHRKAEAMPNREWVLSALIS